MHRQGPRLRPNWVTNRAQITHQTHVDSRVPFPEKRLQVLVWASSPRPLPTAAAVSAGRIHRLPEPGKSRLCARRLSRSLLVGKGDTGMTERQATRLHDLERQHQGFTAELE